MGKEYMSSSNAVIPIILVLSFLSTIGVIYGTLELSDDERNAWEVLKDLLSGKISLQDIWRVLSGRDAEAKAAGACQGVDQNGVYEYDKDGKCIKLGCKLGHYEQDNMCIERRNFSDEVFSGQTSADCEIDGYTYGECIPKLNETCGPGAGTQLKNPNITSGAIGAGSCESATYVDCDIECPDVCSVPDHAYSTPEGVGCMASTPEGESVTLGGEGRYCGQGTLVREIVPVKIPISVIEDAGFQNVDEYLEYANPNGVCPTQISSVCPVECKDGLTDVGCDYKNRWYEFVKDSSGAAICFNKEQTSAFIAGTRTERPEKLKTILATDVITDNGTYDVEGKIPESERKGLYIEYLSDQGMSYDNISKNDCTLFRTKECDAPREKKNCVIGDIDVSDCISPGCGQQMYQSVTRGVTIHPFGDGEACPVEYTNVINRTDPNVCGISKRCCINEDYKPDNVCKSDGKMTYTLDTSSCDQNGLPDTKEVDCCYQSEWKEVEGYEGCELRGNIWKRKFTRDVTIGCAGDNAIKEKYEDRGTCNFDCEINSITMGNQYNGDESGYMCQARSTWSTRQVSAIDFRDPKGSGKACPTGVEGKYYFNTQNLKDALGDIEGPVPDFQCEMVSFDNTLGKLNFVESRNCPPELGNFERCGVIFNRPNLYFGKDGPPEPTERGGGLDPSDSPDGVSTGGRR